MQGVGPWGQMGGRSGNVAGWSGDRVSSWLVVVVVEVLVVAVVVVVARAGKLR